jgi:hypothetical protein
MYIAIIRRYSLYILSNWYVLYIYVDWLLAVSGWNKLLSIYSEHP